MTSKPALVLVDQAEQPAPSYAYEAEQRRRIASKNWAAIHIAGDRREPLSLPDRVKRVWRG